MAWNDGIWAWLAGRKQAPRSAPPSNETELQLIRLEERRVLQGMPVAAPAAASGSGQGHASATYLIARHGHEVDVSLNGVLVKEQSIDQGRLTISALTTGAQFIVDMSGGNPIPKGGLTLIGAQSASGVQNSLIIEPGSPQAQFATVTYSLLANNQGSIVLAGTSPGGYEKISTINLSNITAIEDDTAAASRVLDVENGPQQLTLAAAANLASQSGGASQPAMVLTSSLGPSVTFVDPATSLSIEAAGQPTDTLELASFDLAASLSIEMAGTVTLSGPVQTGGLSVSADSIQLNSTLLAGTSAQFIAQDEINVAQSASIAAVSSIDLEAPNIQQVGNLQLLGPGLVRLNGGTQGTVIVSGRIDASDLGPSGSGGNVQVLGNLIALTGQAVIDVSGNAPGSVVVGGDKDDPSLGPYAARTFIGPQALVMANGVGDASGGRVEVWSSQLTVFEGDIAAQGGSAGGNGGFVEVSSTNSIDFLGQTDLSASHGSAGNLLLDPLTIVITSRLTAQNFTGFQAPTFIEAFSDDLGLGTIIDPSAGGSLNNANGTITLQATEITVATSLNLLTATGNSNVSLVLQAEDSISVLAPITADGTGTITLIAYDPTVLQVPPGVLAVGAAITADAGISLSGASIQLDNQVSGGSIAINADGGAVTTGLGGVLTSTTSITIDDASSVSLGNVTAPDGLILGSSTPVNGVSQEVGSVTQKSGTAIQAGSVSAAATGDVMLTSTTNAIDALGSFSVGGALEVDDSVLDASALFTLDGAISATSAIITNAAGSITVNASVTTTDPTSGICLIATGITLSSGTLDAGLGTIVFDGGAAAMDLTGGTLSSGNLGNTAISVHDASSITLGNVTTAGGLSLGELVNGVNGGPAMPDVASVSQGAGTTIQAASVTANTTGDALLAASGNAIQSIAASEVGGQFQVTNAMPDGTAHFTIGGAITAGSVDISNTGSITDTASITTSAAAGIQLAAAGITQSAGTLDAESGTITLDGGGAAVDLTGGTVGNLNAISVAIHDATSITLGDVITAGGLSLGQLVSVAGQNVPDVGSVSQATGATILAANLTAFATGDVNLANANNAIDALGGSAVGTLELVNTLPDSSALFMISGAITAGSVNISNTGSITDTASITTSAASGIALTGTGITQSSGTLDAVSGSITLTGNVAAVDLSGGSLTSTSTAAKSIAIYDATSITLGGVDTAGGLALGELVIVGGLNQPNVGSVGQANATTIQAASVTADASGSVLLTNSGNQINVLGASQVGGAFNVTDAVPDGSALFTISGGIHAGSVDISNTGSITVSASVTATGSGGITLTGAGIALSSGTIETDSGTLTLDSGTGPINQTGGQLVVDTLTATSGGAIQLGNSANQVSILGTVSRGGDFMLADGEALDVDGPMTAGTTASNVSFVLNGAALTLAGNIITTGATHGISLTSDGITQSSGTLNAGAGTLVLDSGAGSINQTGGGLTANSLTATSGGAIQLGQGANQIAFLGTVTRGGDFTLADGVALEVDGPITAGTTASNVSISVTGAGLALAGDITTTGASNNISLSGVGVALSSGTLDSGAGTLTLNSGTGAIAQSNAEILANTLNATSGGSILLANNTNQIGFLGTVSRGGDFTLQDSVALEVDGPITAGTTANNVSITVSGAALTLAGNITTTGATNGISLTSVGMTQSSGTINTGAGTLTLDSGTGSITQTGGGLAGNTLTVTSGGAIQLGQGTNQIAFLSTVSRGGDFTLSNDVALEVDGPLTAGTTASNVSITVTGAGLTLAGDITTTGATNSISLSGVSVALSSGTLDAGAGTLTLSSGTGGITQTNSEIAANKLTASSGGAVQLGNSTNQVAVLGSVSRGGTFAFEDSVALEVDGPITGGTTTNNVSITVNGAALTLAGNITSTGAANGISLASVGIIQSSGIVDSGAGTLTLDSGTGSITQTGGGLTANSLTATSGGAIQINGGTNKIASLGSITRGGDFTLDDGVALQVNGPITAGTTSNNVSITVNSAALTLAGDITTTGAGSSISLSAAGITQSSGTLDSGLGTISLDGGAAAISLLGTLNSTNTGTAVTIHDASTVGLGTITAAGTVVLGVGQDITGAVTQSGPITAAELQLSGTGSFTLTSHGNSIATLAGSTGGVDLNDSRGISMAGLSSHGNLTLSATGSISQTAALSVSGTSSFSAGANSILLSAANDLVGAVSLNNSGSTDVVLDNSVGLILGTSSVGIGRLELTAAGSITQTGAITQATGAHSTLFMVTAAASDVLLGMANDFSAPVSIAAGGLGSVRDVDLRNIDADARLASLPNSLRNLTLEFDHAAVTLPLLVLTGNLLVTSGGVISQAAAITAAGTTQLSTGAFGIDLNQALNSFGGAVSVANSGTGNVTLGATGPISLGGSNIGSGMLSVTATGISQAGAIVQAASAAGATFNAGLGPITLTSTGNVFTGPVALNNSGLGAVSLTDSQALNLAASSVGSGTLTIMADGITQSGPLVQAALAGAVAFNTGNADLQLDQAGNQLTGLVSLSGSGAAALTLDNAIGLNLLQVLGGSGDLNVQAGGTLTVGQGQSQATAISTSGAVNLETTVGDIVLQQGIQSTAGGVQLNSAGAINMAAGALANAGADLLSFNAVGDIDLAALQTNSASPTAVNLVSQNGQVASVESTPANITTAGGLSITAATGIGSGNPLQVSVGSITASNGASGDIDLASLQATTLLGAQNGGGNIAITSAGTMTVGTQVLGTPTGPTSPAVSTLGTGGITLSTSGAAADLLFNQGVQAADGTIGLTAGGGVTLAGTATLDSTTGNINAAGTTITMASTTGVQSTSGAIALDAARNVVVSSLATGSTVSVTSDTRSISVVAPPVGANITASAAALSAATGIGQSAPVMTSVGTLAASNSTSNGIQAVNVGTGLFTIGPVGTLSGIQLSGLAPAVINVSSAGAMLVAGNVLNTTGGSTTLSSGVGTDLTTTGRIINSGGNGSLVLNAGGNLLLNDTVNQGIANSLLWTPDIQVIGSGTITGNAAGRLAIGPNVLISSGTGSITDAPPQLSSVVTPEIGSSGIATVMAQVGRPGDTNLTVTINWHDGSTTTLVGASGGLIDVSHQYLTNPDLANGAQPVPITITVVGDHSISFAGQTISTVTVPISGTGLFLSYQSLIVVPQPTVYVMQRIDEPVKQVVEVIRMDGFIAVQQPNVTATPSESRVVTLNLVPPGGGKPVPFELPENVADNLPSLFKRLPDGHYQIYVDEPGRQPRLLIDVYLRQGRPVDPDDKSEGTEDRPPTAMLDTAPTKIVVSQTLAAIKSEHREAAAAEAADRAIAASLWPRLPAVALASTGRHGAAADDRYYRTDGDWSLAAATTGAALAGIVVSRPSGNQQAEHERTQVADRTLGRLGSQSLDRAARWSRRVRQHLPSWAPFGSSDNRASS